MSMTLAYFSCCVTVFTADTYVDINLIKRALDLLFSVFKTVDFNTFFHFKSRFIISRYTY